MDIEDSGMNFKFKLDVMNKNVVAAGNFYLIRVISNGGIYGVVDTRFNGEKFHFLFKLWILKILPV